MPRVNIHGRELDLVGPGSLIEFLAGLGAGVDAAALMSALRTAGIDPSLLQALADGAPSYLELGFPPAPADHDLASWLQAVEELELARLAAARLEPGLSWCGGLAASLAAAIDQALAPLLVRGWRDAWKVGRQAELARARVGADVAPWKYARSGMHHAAFDDREVDRAAVLRAWSAERLCDEDEADLRRRVQHDDVWRMEYRATLTRQLADLHVVRVDPALQLRALLAIPLPHLGAGAQLEARLGDDGTVWQWPGRERLVVPFAQHTVRLPGDEVTGPLVSRVHDAERPVPIGHSAWLTVCAARKVLEDEASDPGRARGLVMAVVRAMSGGPWREGLNRAAEAFRRGEEPGEDDLLLVDHGLQARVALEAVSMRLDDVAMAGVVADLDATLAECGPAVLLLDSATYYERLGEVLPDDTQWWGARAALDTDFPDDTADALLGEWAAGAVNMFILQGLFRRWVETVSRANKDVRARIVKQIESAGERVSLLARRFLHPDGPLAFWVPALMQAAGAEAREPPRMELGVLDPLVASASLVGHAEHVELRVSGPPGTLQDVEFGGARASEDEFGTWSVRVARSRRPLLLRVVARDGRSFKETIIVDDGGLP